MDLSNYAIKANKKEATSIDTSTLALKKDLADLKTKLDNLDVDKCKAVPVNLSKFGNVVGNDVVKMNVW